MKKLLMLLVVAAMAFTAAPALAQIASTQHDYIGANAYGRCGVCHVPHAAVGANRLWRVAETVPGGADSWNSSAVAQLCAGCHYGGGQAANNANAVPPKNLGSVIYSDNSHGRDWGVLTGAGAGQLNHALGAVAGKPYTGAGNGIGGSNLIECTSCHNVHYDGAVASDYTKRPFLRPGSAGTGANAMSNFCADCHSDRLSTDKTGTNHVVKVYEDSTGTASIYLQSPPNAAVAKPVTLTSWSLGGKIELGADGIVSNPTVGTDNISCGSCHAVHNPAATGASENQGLHLLALDNTGTTAALCQGCHGGPDTAGVATANGVGGAGDGDHPINIVIGASSSMTIDWWYNNSTDNTNDRNERYDSGADAYWPRGTTDSGTTWTKIICTSCHSAHNARTGEKLKRSLGNAVNFCRSCHSSVSPMAHHSNQTNDGANSSIDCNSCHETSSVSAHNGFGYALSSALLGVGGNNDHSELCMMCHLGGDNSYTTDFTDASQMKDPVHSTFVTNFADHLGVVAADPTMNSHFIGGFTDDANGINVKRSKWNDSAATGGYSKYGTANMHGSAPDGTGTDLICESCHNVLYNAGKYVATPTVSSGWEVNLLLQNYIDDSSGDVSIGSGFCVGCHNQADNATYNTGSADGLVSHSVVKDDAVSPPNMHPMTGWSITRAQDAGYTGADAALNTDAAPRPTYADAASAPNGNTTYPATDQMDCDSCHRPHRAPANSEFNQTQTHPGSTVPVILEIQAAANEYADLCQACHGY